MRNKLLLAVFAVLGFALCAVAERPQRALPTSAESNRVFRKARPASRAGLPLMRNTTVRLFGVTPKAAETPAVEIDGIDLRGYLCYSSTGTWGFYRVPTTADESPELLSAIDIYRARSGTLVGDTYYIAEEVDNGELNGERYYIYSFNPETWELIEKRETEYTRMASDVTTDPVTGKTYGCFYKTRESSNGEVTSWVFGTIDYETLEVTEISEPFSRQWISCAIDADGTMYVIDYYGVLHKVDKATGTKTRIGSTGVNFVSGGFAFNQSAAIDPVTGRMFASCDKYMEGDYIYEINKTTGKATLVYTFDHDLIPQGLYVAARPAADDAPAAVADLAIKVEGASLSGEAVFTAPDKSFGGSVLDGQLKWSITVDETVTANGTAEPGEKVTVPVEVSSTGEHIVTVIVANDGGNSPKAQVKRYFGNDTPTAPVVTLVRDGGNFVVTWNAVTTGIHEGYVDSDNMAYTVTRHPDNVTVARDIKATTVTDPVAKPDNMTPYSYSVTATAAGMTSAAGTTARFPLGEILPPYKADFEAADALDFYTVIDGNNDGRKWSAIEGCLRLPTAFESDADDWAITPPLRLEKGKRYRVTFLTWSHSNKGYTERMEVKWGTAPTPEGMTEYILDRTDIDCSGENPYLIEDYIVPEEDGVYYVGFHGISDVNTMFLYVYNFEIAEGMKSNAPDAVTGLTATPDPEGKMKAHLSFTLPAADIDGNPIEELSKVEIYRNSELVKTLTEGLVPGKETGYTDEVTGDEGAYVYRVIPYSAAGGVGLPADVAIYVGVNIPGRVENIVVTESNGDGEVTLTWEAPATDVNGYPIAPEIISYDIYDITFPDEPWVVATDLKTLSHTYTYLNPASRQMLGQWSIVAKTTAGSGSARASQFLPAGSPYPTPYRESWANAEVHYILYSQGVRGDARWDVLDDTKGITAQDGDNGYTGCAASTENYSAVLGMGKILIPAENPGMTFYTYNVEAGSENNNTLALEVNAGSGWETVTTVTMKELPLKNAWNRVTVSLADYAGKSVQIRFAATTKTYASTWLDNLVIDSMHPVNLTATAVSAPAEAVPGEEFDVTVWVENNGMQPCGIYSVELFRGEERIGAEVIETPIQSGSRATVKFTDSLNPMSPDETVYYARVTAEDDEVEDDDISPEATVTRIDPIYPAPESLTAEGDGETITLSWNEPDRQSFIHPVTEDFESATPYVVSSVEGWTFIDADGAEIYRIDGWDYPGNSQPAAYTVLNAADSPSEEFYRAHSGNQYLMSMAAVLSPRVSHNDDWAISPPLSGASQTISFYAMTFAPSQEGGYEQFEVYYSTTGTAVKDFKKISGLYPVDVPMAWTRFSYRLPEGAKYFAIRCVSADVFMLFIDDVTFTPADGDRTLDLKGYNIFRDGVKLNDEPVAETTFADNVSDDDTHSYVVTAVYDTFGESAASNPVTLSRSSITDVIAAGINVTGGRGEIVITGADGVAVTVVTPDGRTAASLTAAAKTVVPARPGLYIVTAGPVVKKVIVK